MLGLFCISMIGAQQKVGLAQEVLNPNSFVEGEQSLGNLRKQQHDDSLRRVYLEEQMLSLRRTDLDEKRKLLEELRFLKSRDSLLIAKRRLKVDSLRAINAGVVVSPFQDSLFTIFTALGSYSPADRAARINQQVQLLEANHTFNTDSLQIQQTEDNWLLYWKDQIILSVNQQDALWANKEPQELIQDYRASIAHAINTYRKEHSVQQLLTSAGIAILVLCMVALIIVGLGKLMAWLKHKLLKGRKRRFKGVMVRGYMLISPEQELKFIWFITGLMRWFFIFTIVYLTLPILFNLFPSTKGYASVLVGYFLSPLKKVALALIDYFPNLITIVVVYFVFHYLLRVLKFFAKELESGSLTVTGFYSDWAIPTYQILRVLLLAFFLVIIFPYLPGSDSPIFQGISVFIGILFTFSSAGALGNIVAGLMLTYMRSFVVGDRIRIGEVSGDIMEKTLLVTRILTANNEVVSIPNAQVLSSHTVNYSAQADTDGLIMHTKLSISYEVPWQTVHELAKKAITLTPKLEEQPAPFVLQHSLDDFYVTYQLNAYTKEPNKQIAIYSELHKNILDVFHQAGIELMSPHYHAVRDGSTKDMPPNCRKGAIQQPFTVQMTNTDIRNSKT